jgi:hypothetical protein
MPFPFSRCPFVPVRSIHVIAVSPAEVREQAGACAASERPEPLRTVQRLHQRLASCAEARLARPPDVGDCGSIRGSTNPMTTREEQYDTQTDSSLAEWRLHATVTPMFSCEHSLTPLRRARIRTLPRVRSHSARACVHAQRRGCRATRVCGARARGVHVSLPSTPRAARCSGTTRSGGPRGSPTPRLALSTTGGTLPHLISIPARLMTRSPSCHSARDSLYTLSARTPHLQTTASDRAERHTQSDRGLRASVECQVH